MRVLYRNGTANTITTSTGDVFLAGESKTLKRYLPDKGGLTIVKRDGSPIDTIDSGTLPLSATDLANYSQIKIYNATGADMNVSFNGDAAVVWPNGFIDSILSNYEIDSIDITGAGSGSAYVWGILQTP